VGTGLGHYIPTVLYLAGCVSCIVALAGRPLYTFYLIILILPYRTLRDHFNDFPLGGNLFTIMVLTTIAGALIRRKRLPKTMLYLTWAGYAFYLYLSMWLGTALGNAPAPLWLSDSNFVIWKDYLLIPLIFVAAGLVIQDRKTLRTALILTAVSILAINRASLMNSLSRSWDTFDESKRDSGPLGITGSNGLAAFHAQFAMFTWGLAQYIKSRRNRWLLYALTATSMFAAMYCFSRAAYIALVAGTFILGVLKDRKLLLVVGVFLFTWQTIVPRAVSERVLMTQDASGRLEASAQERVDLWTAARDSIIQNPIFGTGYATFMYGQHTDNLKDTHNWYVKVLVETGVIGGVFAIALLVQLIYLPFYLFRRAEDPLYKGLGLGLFLTVCCSIILNIFGDRWTYIEINGLLWLLAGLAARARQLDQAAQEAPAQLPAEPVTDTNPFLAYR